MSDDAHRLIRESWERIRPMGDRLAVSFYERLFAQNPAIAALFGHTHMKTQRDKFIVMLSEIVRVIDRPELLVSEVADSGRRHVGYGVKERDYADVGAALLWALQENLGPAFTPDVRDAWRSTYELLAAVMKRAASHTA